MRMMMKDRSLKKELLLLVPLGTYIVSYVCLALYHRKVFLFDTVIHEGGAYSLLQTVLYASHFLGHVPVHTVYALIFTGTYLCLADPSKAGDEASHLRRSATALGLFISAAIVVSLAWFGMDDTLAFVLQEKQNMTVSTRGGSWNLHLPSTMLMPLAIPCYLMVHMHLFHVPTAVSRQGVVLVGAGFILLILLTMLFNGASLHPLLSTWTDPRYLAHSVRECATFPLVYFPLPLYIFFRKKAGKGTPDHGGFPAKAWPASAVLALLFIALLAYQAAAALGAGIGTMAQKPGFAGGSALPVYYLIASHYFEHVLDTVYFTLLCVVLFNLQGVSRRTDIRSGAQRRLKLTR